MYILIFILNTFFANETAEWNAKGGKISPRTLGLLHMNASRWISNISSLSFKIIEKVIIIFFNIF